MNEEIVVWPKEELDKSGTFEAERHTFILGFDDGPICGYSGGMDYDRVCIVYPRHAGQPHFVVTGQAHARFPYVRVIEIICHGHD